MYRWLLALIFLLGFTLRILDLANTPSGFTPDEASFGYDAYSLLQTGADQWGERFPLSLRSFGDFKLPLYTYLAMPSIGVFGLSEFAVRLPNALIGSLAVLATYLFVLEYLKYHKSSSHSIQSISLTAAFLLAVSPWHVSLSRGAFEANLTSFFLTIGLWAFYKGIKHPMYVILTALAFGLNLFTYHSARILTPVIALFLLVSFTRKIRITKAVLLSCIIFVFCGIVAGVTLLNGGGSRASTAGIFNPTEGWEAVAQDRYLAVLTGQPTEVARIFHNKLTYVVSQFSRNYLSYFSPQFLFTQGPAEATYGMVPGQGVLYIFELFFLLAYIRAFLTGKVRRVNLLIFWFAIAFVAPALAKGVGFAANRAAFALPVVHILSAIGAVELFHLFQNTFKKRPLTKAVLLGGFIILSGASFAFFAQTYVIDQKAAYSKAMIYGMRDLTHSLKEIEDQYDQILISKKISEPQIFIAFYQKVDPLIVQQESRDWLRYEQEGKGWVDQLGTYKLNKYMFSSFNNDMYKLQNTLLVGEPFEFIAGTKPQKIIYSPTGEQIYWLVNASPL